MIDFRYKSKTLLKRGNMEKIQQIVPVSDMSIKQTEVMKLLINGPVVLAQRSKPAAVLVSVEEWDRQAEELARLRRIVLSDRQFSEMDAGYFADHDEAMKALKG